MTAREMVRHFRARGPSRGPWRFRCPVHRSRGLTGAIYADAERTTLHCFAGCSSDAILAAVGLTWKDCYYSPRVPLDPKAAAEARRKREEAERRASDLRIGQWIIRFARDGYTRGDRDSDVTAVLACALVLANGEKTPWDALLRVHLERMSAANYCLKYKMLPMEKRL